MKIGKKLLIPILSLGLLFSANSGISYASAIDKMTEEDWEHIEYPQYSDPSQYDNETWYVPNDPEETKINWIEEVKKQQYGMGENKTVLIDRDLNKVTINKIDDEGNPVKGVTFRIYWTKEDMENDKNYVKDDKDENAKVFHVLEGTTNEEGKLTFNLSKDPNKNDEEFKEDFKYYGFYVKETKVPAGYELSDEYIYFYKDNGVRFLGEMEPDKMKFIYKNEDGKEVKKENPGKEDDNINAYLEGLIDIWGSFNRDTSWLVFNDNGVEKLVAKKPLIEGKSWESLNNAGLVYGDKTRITINKKVYKVRLMRAYNESIGINDDHNWSYKDTNHINATKGSEWNRLILPLIDPTDDKKRSYLKGSNGRYGSNSEYFVEKNMPTLANYSWWGDFGGCGASYDCYGVFSQYGVHRWMQETGYNGSQYRALRGSYDDSSVAAHAFSKKHDGSSSYIGWLPVLEEVKEKPFKLYAAEGWVKDAGNEPKLTKNVKEEELSENIGGNNFSTGYDELGNFYTEWKYGNDSEGPFVNSDNPKDKERTVKFFGEIKVKDLEVKDADGNDIPENKTLNTYLQGLIPESVDKDDKKINVDFNKGTNWLVFNDNGVEKLVAKKPLKHSISWNELYNAGVVFGTDTTKEKLKDEADFTHSNYNSSNVLRTNKDYKQGKGKDKSYEHQYVEINGNKYIVRLMRSYSDEVPINNREETFGQYDKIKGSEWNRLILPLISDGRSGTNAKKYVETNMPILANYSWWKDFGGNTKISNNMDQTYYGVYRWMQESGYDGSLYRAVRGRGISYGAAAYSSSGYPSDISSSRGWLPVLERVDNN